MKSKITLHDGRLNNISFIGGPCRIWLQLVPCCNDLEIEEACIDWLGDCKEPEWLRGAIDDFGLETILDIPYSENRINKFGLHHGIAPRQPFLVEIDPPRYWTSNTQDGTEYEAECCGEIVQISPISSKMAAHRWNVEIKSQTTWTKARDAALEKLEKDRRADVKSMFVTVSVYFAPGQSSYDDMEMPNGVEYSLDTKHAGGYSMLASGRNDDGDYTKAMDEMISDAVKKLPHLAPEKIRTFPINHLF